MKGIILAGGTGSRLFPITEGISKQLMPIYDKPMIFYPLSTLMSAGINDIMIISTEEDQAGFKRLLGNGDKFGINLHYVVQPSPDGLAQAFLLDTEYIKDESVAMILGDNIFYGANLTDKLKNAALNAEEGKATIFGYQVKDPERFGIMEIDNDGKVLSVEEKPENPKSDYAITGLYFYPQDVVEKALLVTPSDRGELEITTLNDLYLQEDRLQSEVLGDGYTWYDTGTFESMNEASNMIKSIETQGERLISSPELIAYKNGWLDRKTIDERVELLSKNTYGKYLKKALKGR